METTWGGTPRWPQDWAGYQKDQVIRGLELAGSLGRGSGDTADEALKRPVGGWMIEEDMEHI